MIPWKHITAGSMQYNTSRRLIYVGRYGTRSGVDRNTAAVLWEVDFCEGKLGSFQPKVDAMLFFFHEVFTYRRNLLSVIPTRYGCLEVKVFCARMYFSLHKKCTRREKNVWPYWSIIMKFDNKIDWKRKRKGKVDCWILLLWEEILSNPDLGPRKNQRPPKEAVFRRDNLSLHIHTYIYIYIAQSRFDRTNTGSVK